MKQGFFEPFATAIFHSVGCTSFDEEGKLRTLCFNGRTFLYTLGCY
jgi:hypothetical protein